MTHDTARLIIEVSAGVIPGQAEPQYSRAFSITGNEWATARESGTHDVLLAQVNGKAQGYAGLLMLQPQQLNWVRTDWIWL